MHRLLLSVLGCGLLVLGWRLAPVDGPGWSWVEGAPLWGQEADSRSQAAAADFQRDVRAFFERHCTACHDEANRESGIRVDHLDDSMPDASIALWEGIRRQVYEGKMPPEEEPRPSDDELVRFDAWIEQALHAARLREAPRNGSVRRLTVSQYGNALRELLQLDEDLTDLLPPDAISKEGFTNQIDSLQLSPLQLEAYFQIAERTLDQILIDPAVPPVIQKFRMDLGRAINPEPCPDTLVLGALNHLLRNEDFVVTEPGIEKPFAFTSFRMQRQFRFIEGYQGNDTVRDWREFNSIYHAVFACMRGSEGYPKGRAYEVAVDGLLLRPAIPSPEIFGESSTYGPHANFKISLRELPERGRFRVTVRAAQVSDALILDGASVTDASEVVASLSGDSLAAEAKVSLAAAGIYRLDLRRKEGSGGNPEFTLTVGGLPISAVWQRPEWSVLRLEAGEHTIRVEGAEVGSLERVDLVQVDESDPIASEFLAFEKRAPRLGVYVGLRRDCGSTLSPLGERAAIESNEFQDYVFEGEIADFPSPDVEVDNVNYLAGIREIGVRSEYTDGRDRARLAIQSVTFEGPYYESWPPAPYRSLIGEAALGELSRDAIYDVIVRFAERAFRRPLTSDEALRLTRVYDASWEASSDPRESLRDALLVVLTSPQFLFLIETSSGPQAEPLSEWELASKLAFFLWNSPPDERLLELARAGKLRESLESEFERMVSDSRFEGFVERFTREWLGLDKFDVVELDAKRFPRLTRDVRAELRREPVQFLGHWFRENRPVVDLVASDYVLANEVTAAYYDLGGSLESGFDFVSLPHRSEYLGGLVTQAALLSGLSDGREGNPVKRGAWFARKLVAMPPDDPPPNVPQLEDLTELSLRERLERHRNVEGCRACHERIDPWGLPFERFDAAGLAILSEVDDAAKLPDGVEVDGFVAFRDHVSSDLEDSVTFSLLQHVTIYAVGRKLTYGEDLKLRERVAAMTDEQRRARALLKAVVLDETFLSK